jgi:hypothetical protein
MDWSIVFVATYPQDIYPAQNLLESEGITTFLKDELTAQVNNFYSTAIGGVKLLVHNDDLERSRELLIQGGYIRSEDYQAPPEIEVVRTVNRTHCPYCGSEQISKKKEVNPATIIAYFFIHVMIPIFKKTWMCWDCGRSWKFGQVKQRQ